MATLLDDRATDSATPLEDFLRRYLETIDGDWDEVEPQVYDVLVPPQPGGSLLNSTGGVLRLTFDPEAIPEHPGCQLASFGTPLVDALLADALRRGRSASFCFIGLNLTPHGLESRAQRTLQLAEALSLQVGRIRPLFFPQAIFWFQVEFSSDQKEQTIVPVALDLHYAREVRHLDLLLDRSRLAVEPAQPLPEVRRSSLVDAYPAARDQVLRSVAALANSRDRELRERCEQQVARMRQYYADLRQELAGPKRGKQAEDTDDRRAARKQTIDREEQVRVAELRQKSQLRVELRLLEILVVQQPKLLIKAHIADGKRAPVPLDLVWDPLTESLEAPPCPSCGRPGYAFQLDRQRHVTCANCRS
jgi:hypothetical protein